MTFINNSFLFTRVIAKAFWIQSDDIRRLPWRFSVLPFRDSEGIKRWYKIDTFRRWWHYCGFYLPSHWSTWPNCVWMTTIWLATRNRMTCCLWHYLATTAHCKTDMLSDLGYVSYHDKAIAVRFHEKSVRLDVSSPHLWFTKSNPHKPQVFHRRRRVLIIVRNFPLSSVVLTRLPFDRRCPLPHSKTTSLNPFNWLLMVMSPRNWRPEKSTRVKQDHIRSN